MWVVIERITTLIRYPSTQASSYAHGVDKRGPQGQIRPGAEIANRPEYVKRGDINRACVLGCSVSSVNAMLSNNFALLGRPVGMIFERNGQKGGEELERS